MVLAGFEDEVSVLLEGLRTIKVTVFRVVRSLEDAKEALDHMVAMHIEAKHSNVRVELVDDHHQVILQLRKEFVKHLNQELNRSCTMDIH